VPDGQPREVQIDQVVRQLTEKEKQVTHTHTPTDNTSDTDTHAHDKNNTPNPKTNTSHKHATTLEGGATTVRHLPHPGANWRRKDKQN